MLGFTSVLSVDLQNSVPLFSINVVLFQKDTSQRFESKLMFRALSQHIVEMSCLYVSFLILLHTEHKKQLLIFYFFLVDIPFTQKRILTFNSIDPM